MNGNLAYDTVYFPLLAVYFNMASRNTMPVYTTICSEKNDII